MWCQKYVKKSVLQAMGVGCRLRVELAYPFLRLCSLGKGMQVLGIVTQSELSVQCVLIGWVGEMLPVFCRP